MQTLTPVMAPQMTRPTGFVADLSAADFSGQMGLVQGTGGVAISFGYARIRVTDPLNPDEHGQWKTVLQVRKRPYGDKYTESVRMISERTAQQLYPREYAWFKQNQDVPTDGTPLQELPGLSQSQIGILLIHGIRCVEDLISLTTDQVSQIGMDARTAHALATRWDAARKANTDMIAEANREAALKAELDKLRADSAAQSAVIAEMSARLKVLTEMGVTVGQGALPAGHTAVQMVDSDDLPDAGDAGLFAGGGIATGNEDLEGDPPEAAPAPALPGLDRKPRRG